MPKRLVDKIGFTLLLIGGVLAIDRYFEIQRLSGIQRLIDSAEAQSIAGAEDAFRTIRDFVDLGIDAAGFALRSSLLIAAAGGVLQVVCLLVRSRNHTRHPSAS